MIPFGPPLIGQTEKSLNALLLAILEPHDLSEAQWVTLRLASQGEATMSLAHLVKSRAHIVDTDSVLSDLRHRSLLDKDRLTERGLEVIATISDEIAVRTRPLWDSLDQGDVNTTERLLNTVLERARQLLGSAATAARPTEA